MNISTELSDIEWLQDFAIESQDCDHVINLFIESGVPCNTDQLVLSVVMYRLTKEQEEKVDRDVILKVKTYNPVEKYKLGDVLTFPGSRHFDGEIQKIRQGYNPNFSDFEVVEIICSDNVTRSFVHGMQDDFFVDLQVNVDANLEKLAKQIVEESEIDIADKIVSGLAEFRDLICLSDFWFSLDLLLEIDDGYLNLVEAVLDIADGQPLSTIEILERIDFSNNSDQELLVFSLNYVLNNDNRFEDVGPSGKVLWFLTSMKPPELVEVDNYLLCQKIDVSNERLSSSMQSLVNVLSDEFSLTSKPLDEFDKTASIILIYPHLRAGTLPLNQSTSMIFPSALVSPRVKMTLIDKHTGASYPGWVIQKDRFVWGLEQLYQKYGVVAGTRISIEVGNNLDEVTININRRKPVKEWVKTLIIDDMKIQFEMKNREIGVDCLDESLICVDDISLLDKFCRRILQGEFALEDLVDKCFRALKVLMPQGNVHAVTLYCAINIIVRVVPEAVFAILENNSNYIHVGDAYWRYEVN